MRTPLAAAIRLATTAHDGQTDKIGDPYLSHPLRVMAAAATVDPWDERAPVVAVLHDVVEDTDVTLDDLRWFGPTIVDAIDAITKRDGELLSDYWTRVQANDLARRVKLLDIDDNSAEWRLAKLPDDVAGRLRTKYADARHLLA